MCTSSILNLCAISVDRYLAITEPIKYRLIMTTHRVKMIIGLVWVVSFLICLPPLIGLDESPFYQARPDPISVHDPSSSPSHPPPNFPHSPTLLLDPKNLDNMSLSSFQLPPSLLIVNPGSEKVGEQNGDRLHRFPGEISSLSATSGNRRKRTNDRTSWNVGEKINGLNGMSRFSHNHANENLASFNLLLKSILPSGSGEEEEGTQMKYFTTKMSGGKHVSEIRRKKLESFTGQLNLKLPSSLPSFKNEGGREGGGGDEENGKKNEGEKITRMRKRRRREERSEERHGSDSSTHLVFPIPSSASKGERRELWAAGNGAEEKKKETITKLIPRKRTKFLLSTTSSNPPSSSFSDQTDFPILYDHFPPSPASYDFYNSNSTLIAATPFFPFPKLTTVQTSP